MIVGSLLLILVAVGLLVLGLAQGSSAMLIGSIVASLLAAVALVIGARQAAAARAGARAGEPFPAGPPADGYRPDGYRPDGYGYRSDEYRPDGYRPDEYVGAPVAGQDTATIPAKAMPAEDPEPADEPVPQEVPAGEAAQVARMSSEVLVVDGRPRYHVSGCVHLIGRATEPLPVSEAVELGFTPCGLCEPDSALLAGARQV